MSLDVDGILEIRKPSTSTNFYISGVIYLEICDGTYPLPEVISVVKDEVTFTFTPIPVYE